MGSLQTIPEALAGTVTGGWLWELSARLNAYLAVRGPPPPQMDAGQSLRPSAPTADHGP